MTTESNEATNSQQRRLERLQRYKEQALASIAQQQKNSAAPGVSAVSLSPNDVLLLISTFEDSLVMKEESK